MKVIRYVARGAIQRKGMLATSRHNLFVTPIRRTTAVPERPSQSSESAKARPLGSRRDSSQTSAASASCGVRSPDRAQASTSRPDAANAQVQSLPVAVSERWGSSTKG